MAVKITANGIDTIQNDTISASNIIDSSISPENLPSGSLLQSKFVNARYDWGSIGNTSPWELTWMAITLTTLADNSTFLINAQYATDDTNSAAYGCGIGIYVTGSTITDGWWFYPAAHERYDSRGSDMYIVPKMQAAYSPGYPKGTTFTLHLYGRNNNSNQQRFLGNDTTYWAQRHHVQEIKG